MVVLATVVGLLVAQLAPTADLWLGDRFVRTGPADERVVVLALDSPFLEQADRSPLLWERLISRLRGSPLVFELQLEAMTNPGVRDHEWRPLYVGYLHALRSETVAVAPHPVVVESGDGVPTLLAAGWDDEMAAVVTATGFDESGALPEDRMSRTVPLVARMRGRGADLTLASAAFATARLVEGDANVVAFDDGTVKVGHHRVTDSGAKFRPVLADDLLPGGAQVVPALDLIDERVRPADLADSVVVVGVTDPGRATMVETAVGDMPEVHLRANVISSLLLGQQQRTVPTAWTGVIALAAALVVALGLRRSYRLGLAALAAVGLAIVVLGNVMAALQVVPSLLAVYVAALVAFAAGVVVRTRIERQRLRDVTDLFDSYVPGSVARRLLEDRAREAILEGVRLDATVLFCDLRGFTELCDHMEPADVRRLLELYYAAVSDTVLANGGTVVQYVGDEVFSIFGAPDVQPDHATRALACAVQLLDELPRLQQRARALGLPTIAYGVGVHTGPLVSASVGTDRRRQYGVVGQTVNIGARLCARAGVGIALVSDATRSAASSDDRLRPACAVELAGVARPVVTYELIGAGSVARESIQMR